MIPTQQSMMKVKIKIMRMTRMVLAMRPMRSPVSVMMRSIELSAMVGNEVFTLSTTRATHLANRRTLWAHVNRQCRAGGLYDIDATEDMGDAEDGEKKKPTKTTLVVISLHKAIVMDRGEWCDVVVCKAISS
jgi:hypothetical protein